MKRFCFNSSKIHSLQEKYAKSVSSEFDAHPTHIEALSAFIWSRFMATTQTGINTTIKKYAICHAVNLRTRSNPPLLEQSFGNLYRVAMAVPNLESKEESYGVLKEMRSAISRLDAGFIKELTENESHLQSIEELVKEVGRDKLVLLSCTSTCRFPFYKADFGWGKPVWVVTGRLPFKNVITFFDAREENGIEAWIYLEKKDMDKFESG